MNQIIHKHKGAIFAILSGFCYGLVGYFGINILDAHITIPTMLFWRFMVAGLFMCMLLLPRKSRQIHTASSKKEMLSVIVYGAALYSGTSIGYFSACKYIGTGPAMVVSFTYPAIIMLIHYFFFNTRITMHYFIALMLILSGMTLLVDTHSFALDMAGIGFGLLSALFYAAYIIANKKNVLSPIVSTLMVSIGCMTTSFIIAYASGTFTIPNTPHLWFNIIGLGILCTALPILFLLQSLKYISPQKASLLSVLEPVFVVIFGIMLLGESINLKQGLGILVILCGAGITLFNSKCE